MSTTRRSFFGAVLGGLAAACGLSAPKKSANDILMYGTKSEVEAWFAHRPPYGLRKGEFIRIDGTWSR